MYPEIYHLTLREEGSDAAHVIDYSKKYLSEPECITFELQFTIAINMV